MASTKDIKKITPEKAENLFLERLIEILLMQVEQEETLAPAGTSTTQ